MKTLYYGLAGAYFTNDSGNYAGTGIPGNDGWKWTENAAISGNIIDLIKTYEGAREATFVRLPVSAL